VVRELTAADADIRWTVHLANKKAAWYCIKFAMDIPEAQAVPRRNPLYKGNRKNLIIDPGPRCVDVKNPTAMFDTGLFLGMSVPLGEIRSEKSGNLIVLGGLGNSGTLSDKRVDSFDSVEWYDDNADGPVTAEVKIDGRKVEVDPAWVIVAPPDYAPNIRSVVTMYDLIHDVAVTYFDWPEPTTLSFTEHIYPIFEALAQLQWVNLGIFLDHGWGSADHFLHPGTLRRLADNSPENQDYRMGVFRRFRDPDNPAATSDAMPFIYGDAMGDSGSGNSPRQWLSMTRLQYRWLRLWSEGKFMPGHTESGHEPRSLEDLPVHERPKALIRAALEPCQGGPFHPGCEAPWIMRQSYLYSGPFRIKPRTDDNMERDYGDKLSPQATLSSNGPLNGSGPGDITRWMALPWQADAFGCGSGYEPRVNPHLPTFWPARVPNHVLTERTYKKMLGFYLGDTQRLKYFSHRQEWLRHLSTMSLEEKLAEFIKEWASLGILTRMSMPQGTGDLPSEVFVEIKNLNEAEPDPGATGGS
jgi:hypothetical protein